MPSESSTVDAASRRLFCVRACQMVTGAAAFALCPASEAAALTPLPDIDGEVKGDNVQVRLGGTVLEAAGGKARVNSRRGSFLVARVSEQQVVALLADCSHEVCPISDADGDVYVCRCHGSRFDLRGGVIAGPAETPLYAYEAGIEGQVLTIKLG